MAKLNVDADKLAKDEWKKQYQNGVHQVNPTSFEGNITIEVGGEPLTRIRNNEIYNKIINNLGKSYWVYRLGWKKEIPSMVSWDEMHIASRNTTKTT